MLTNYVKTLENQLESYKKEIETFIKYYDIFETYDNAMDNLKQSNKEKIGIVSKIQELERQVEVLKPFKEKYYLFWSV